MPAPADTAVLLTSESSAEGVVDLPESVVVLAGQTQAEFTVTGLEPGIARISATLNGNTVSQDLTVLDSSDI